MLHACCLTNKQRCTTSCWPSVDTSISSNRRHAAACSTPLLDHHKRVRTSNKHTGWVNETFASVSYNLRVQCKTKGKTTKDKRT